MTEDANSRVSEWILTWDLNSEHRTGTDGDRETSQWLCESVTALGAEAVLDEFAFQRKVPTGSEVKSGDLKVSGVPLFDCLETPLEGVTGKCVSEPDGDSILVVEAGPGGNAMLNDARRNSLARGIVVVSKGQKAGLSLINADAFATPFGPPVLQVATEDGAMLNEWIQAETPATLTVRFDLESTVASNVQTTVKGTNENLPPVVVMTPKSSWWTCTAERMGGIVIWLECIRHLVKHPPRRTVIFTANTGHELGHVGMSRFLTDHPQLGENAAIWVHYGANFASPGAKLRIQGSDQEVIDQVIEQLRERDEAVSDIVGPATRPAGEARDIYDSGGSYISMLASNRLFHHPDDRMSNNIDLLRLMRLSDAWVETVAQLANA